MSLTLEDVKKSARLARLKLSSQEEEKFLHDLNNIFSWIDQLNEVDTDGVEPLNNVHDGVAVMHDDVVADGDKVKEVLANAPVKPIHNFYRVPKVVE